MPLTAKGQKILEHMEEEYGKKKGEQVFYASANKGSITGVHHSDSAKHDASLLGSLVAACDAYDRKEITQRPPGGMTKREFDQRHKVYYAKANQLLSQAQEKKHAASQTEDAQKKKSLLAEAKRLEQEEETLSKKFLKETKSAMWMFSDSAAKLDAAIDTYDKKHK